MSEAAERAGAIDELAARLRRSRRTTVLTGAGVSAASGIPTYRASGGLWGEYSAADLATLDGFERDPALVWKWYDWRRTQLTGCRPNRAHEVLAAWSGRLANFTLITQNVDGLHEQAGSRDLIRLHGSIWSVRCLAGCAAGAPRDDRRAPLPELPPRCGCGAVLRPDVVWFGEMLDPGIVARAEDALECDVFIAAGTSAVVYPAAGFIAAARRRGAFCVEINTEATDASRRVHQTLLRPAEEALAELDLLLQDGRP